MSWIDRLVNVLRPERLSRDLDAEMTTHLSERVDDLVAEGMPRDQATAEARRRFGNRAGQKEAAHQVDGIVWLESFVADIRYSVRALRMSPGFTVVAVLSLALGIGANTAIFSLINAVALKSLPVRDPEQLLLVNMGADGGETFTNPLWEQIRDQSSPFAATTAYSGTTFNLANGGEEKPVEGSWVSGGFFQTLGVGAVAGRLLEPADDVRGCPPVATVSAGFATRQFGSPASAIGKSVSLDGHPFVVIGAIDAGFNGVEIGRRSDIYVPICSQVITSGEPGLLDQRSTWYLNILARPRSGMPLAQATARFVLLAGSVFRATVPANFSSESQRDYLKGTLDARPAASGLSDFRKSYSTALWILMGVVGAVLIIACANIANLLLARAASRQRELAIRMAIGAGRGRLIRQLLTESVLLSVVGAAGGVVFARWASRALVAMLSSGGGSGVWLDLSLDGRVLGFTAGIAVVTGIVFGLAPAWRAAHVDPQAAMKSGGRGVVRGDARHRIGRGLVVGQVALSLVLIVAAGLLLGSLRRLMTIDPGFRRDVVIAQLDFGHAGFKGQELVSVPTDMLRRIREIPGVANASASWTTPIGHMGWNDFVIIPGFNPPKGSDDALANFNQVTDGYFTTLGTRLIAGRDVSADDIIDARSVAVINQAMARRMFAGVNPLGRSFRTPMGDSAGPAREVVGVVADTKYQRLQEKQRAIAYYPLGVGGDPNREVSFEVRSSRPTAELVRDITALAASTSPGISLKFNTLAAQVAESLTRPRLLAVLAGFFGALALALAMIGLYGTIAYNVAQRQNEIGIRVALGAGSGRVLRMVVGEAGTTVMLGVIVGTGIAIFAARVLASFLYGLTTSDPATLIGSAAVLAITGVLAASIPAWRAARLDPMRALREE